MTTINPKIFKAYDIRGVVPTEMNEESIENIARAIYTFFSRDLDKKDLKILVGRDMRISSPPFHKKIVEAFTNSGAEVMDIGIVPTPSVYFAVKKYGYDVGIQISASHNPAEYNGIKMVKRGEGETLIKIGKATGMDEVKRIAMEGDFAEYTNDGKYHEVSNIMEEEITKAIEAINPQHIDAAQLKIVADPANAMGIVPLAELFKRYPQIDLVKMNFELDGTFPAHQADPLQFKLHRWLQDKVIEEHADLGISTDGDADRVFFIDEKGEIIPATLITSLIAREILMKNPGEKILFDIRYTRNAERVVAKYGGTSGYTKVGHAFITQQVNDEHAYFAGESSGHFYFREMGGCESSMRIVLYVLEAIAREKKPISEILKELQTSIESGETNFKLAEGTEVKDLIASIQETYHTGEISLLDGISINFPEWRFNIRTSNTEPLLRLNVEGENVEIVKEKVAELTQIIMATGAHIEE